MRRLLLWEPNWQVHDKAALLSKVSQYLFDERMIVDADAITRALTTREDLGNDLVAPNVAIPHAQHAAVEHAVMLMVKLRHPLLDWCPGADVDRYVFSLIPPTPSARDAGELKEFYTDIADDQVMDRLSLGDQREIRTIFASRRKTTVEPLSLNAVLDRNTILTKVEAERKDEVIATLSQRLYEQGYISSVDEFVQAVNQREREGATGIGQHVAIPHGRSETVTRNGVAIAILDHEIEWESLDDTGAKVVVLLTVGAGGQGSQDHLKMLSLFARKLGKNEVIEGLLKANTIDDVIATFSD
ncbi:PTS sugar transporter subunit IIA [Bifidobacterium psychraerophilum]|jgi:PTS system fructose-specific IIA component|uniref:PTS sugar transporter subunit IIA n=1 Tax=Bifidobacterium psychraerophilum TaxID=218140 RepID=UPI0023F395AE|nr:fructose PTS transporter subunit IIA [Bifidobacterium psychraerophilum]MCI1661161.1 fructose PTS transporter subunit IIA [Bifidobacterium psychraerophilum]MCI1803997.1 fructose PTS transporter subunit IIA [Bifidobacterium psychraerophilum]MCI2175705.1 fructose PTS transporter subunit IIA [Bifidobacterium psychraerophilum]MCI2181711.1 fructose PTS transporter subunit IIA [Bifidobacterium psychraerophilum]